MQKILCKVRKGTKVYYIPGNHDEMLRDYANMQLGGVILRSEMIHKTADGRRLLVLHGDQFDSVMPCARWLVYLGDCAYTVILNLNDFFNVIRRKLGYPYWSLSTCLKNKMKNAVNFISNYGKFIAEEALYRKVDGIVCGHIHHAEICEIDGILYCNDGDWVENCTALVEDWDGALSLIQWSKIQATTEKQPNQK